ncbi:sushi, von Willebrand factor type A, EGF and pentraxin domain-containing protein 1-like isoform X2 [Argopecten irradians]|uniref:sushi, von Willebrand factor type A, EGF and pentraxin domain-containing protein 1-like isoform X2 n=1 Tax=Argopecten irradians TaxID=31199 RepID=UPI00371A506E
MGLVGFPRQLHCDSGYQGFRTVMCLSNGNWLETENNCTASGCGMPPSIPNAVISYGNTTTGSTGAYECIPTSTPSGSGNITCQQNGTWSASSLVCDVQDCGTPLTLSNAIISAGNTTQGSTRTYECIHQSTASGSGDITCQSDGTWTVASLMCNSDCVVVTNMLNAFTSATVAPAGTTISYTCHAGFVQTAGTGNRFCNEQGSWEALDITCNPTNDCGNPPMVSNATVSNGSTTIGSTRTYECVPASTASGFGEITCQPNKTWSVPSLVCIPDCVIDPVLGNAYTTATQAPANSIVLYICMPDYVQTAGTGYRVCGTMGEWTIFDITCTHYTQSGASDQDG